VPVVYDLTGLTGRRRNENRRMVVATFEVKRHTFLVSAASFAVSLPVAGLAGLLVGIWALFVPVIAIIAGLWLWDSRQRRGLELLNGQAIVDSRRARNGELYAAGQPIPKPQLVMHQRQFIPTPATAERAPIARGRNNLSQVRGGSRRGRKSAEAHRP